METTLKMDDLPGVNEPCKQFAFLMDDLRMRFMLRVVKRTGWPHTNWMDIYDRGVVTLRCVTDEPIIWILRPDGSTLVPCWYDELWEVAHAQSVLRWYSGDLLENRIINLHSRPLYFCLDPHVCFETDYQKAFDSITQLPQLTTRGIA